MSDLVTELERLQALRDAGGITDEEFAAAKEKLLSAPAGYLMAPVTTAPWGITRRAVLWAVAVIAVLLGLVGGGWAYEVVDSAQTYIIHGTVSAPSCIQGYNLENSAVEVRDADNKLVGSTSTGTDNTTSSTCHVSFAVSVPKSNFYQVKIGTHGGPSYTFAEMQTLDWKLDLNLGG